MFFNPLSFYRGKLLITFFVQTDLEINTGWGLSGLVAQDSGHQPPGRLSHTGLAGSVFKRTRHSWMMEKT